MNSLGSIYERCNGKAKVLFSTSNLAGYDSASLLRLSSAINPESRISIGCAGAVVSDIRRRCEVAIITNDHEVSKISMFTLKDFMFVNLDSMVSLQIINSEMHPNSLIWGPQNPSTGSKESLSVYGLFHSLASSSLGKLKLRKLFLRPVLDMHVINQRQQTIGLLVRPENQDILYSISKALRGVKNIRSSLEQLKKGTDPVMGRGSSDNGVWGTVQKFCSSVTKIREIVSRVSGSNLPPIIQSTLEAIHSPNMHAVGQMISHTVNLERSQPVSRAVVAEGVDTQLDELRRTYDGMESLLNEAAQHMIGTIPSWARDCISNCIFYPQLGFLTVIPINPDTNTARYSGEGMPDSEWEQMFAADGNAFFKNNAMRELDAQFGDMYSMISDLEIEILHQLSLQVIRYEESLVAAGDACAELDCMIALALGAQKYGWTQPTMTDENVIQIKGGRHPLQELVVPVFISNDCNLAGGIGKDSPIDSGSAIVSESGDPPRTLVITGPNHSGKSVYMKHVALIVYLAHIGSFVPAKSAVIGITDKILTRISTRESAGQNQSAFTIDLQQIAFAARMATRRSLVLVDEFGKGTRADDGAALLAALIDHFAAYGVEAPKMIVATHFHEIIQGGYLKSCPGINLAHMEVRDMKDKAANSQDRVIYLYQLQEGPSLSSFGAICASLNGVDDKVVQRAEALMASMSLNKDLRSICSEMTAEEQFKFEVAEEAARGFLRLPLDSIDLIGDKTMHATDVIRGLLQDTLKQRVGDE
ncbi:hypothetical protein Cpir12675_002774 [Ceratocystis pirilliformis]|uniref:DNA mismatch repair proteins mutS family domain-containing protein n=1 Tax=Ceratocystis pirilliformis TaxID=259994 RepID=A0ABR3Z761_9PEZI